MNEPEPDFLSRRDFLIIAHGAAPEVQAVGHSKKKLSREVAD